MWKNRHKISLVSVSVLVFGSILFPTPASAVEPVPVIQLVSVSASSDTYLVGAAVTINMSLQVASGQSYSGVISAWVCEVGVTPCVEKGIKAPGVSGKTGTFVAQGARTTLPVGQYYINRVVISDAFEEDVGGALHYFNSTTSREFSDLESLSTPGISLSGLNFSILASIPEPDVIPPTQDDTVVIDDTLTTDDSLISDETVLVDDTPVLDDTVTADDSIQIDDTNILVIEDTTITLDDTVYDETLIIDDSVQIDDTLVIDETVITDAPRVVEQPAQVQSTPAPTESTPTPESPPVAQQQTEPPTAVTQPVTTVIETQIVTPVVVSEPELKPIEAKDDTTEVVVETVTLEKTPEVVINVQPWLPAKSRDSKVALGGQVTAIKGAGSQLQRWVDQGSGSLIFERSTQGAKVQIYLGGELIGEHSLFGNRSRTVFSWNRPVFKSKQVLTIKTLAGPKGSSVRLDAIEINGRLLLNPKFMMQIGSIKE